MKRLPLRPQRLYARLSLALLGLFVLVAAAFVWLLHWSNAQYSKEVSQRLNASLATYIAERQPLMRNGEPNGEAMNELAQLVMTINPGVEVYLLDRDGRILDHALPAASIVRERIDPTPIRALIDGTAEPPLMAQDPRSAEGTQIFSAARIAENERTQGYLYVGLASQEYRNLADSLFSSHVLRLTLAGVIGIALFGFAAATLIFNALTRPLTRLAERMIAFQRDEIGVPVRSAHGRDNEVTVLSRGFEAMRQRINDQFQRLAETDRMRRELVSSISHDLRTPLASMQGYLETLLIKHGTLSETQRRQYQAIAYRHCGRLTRLVNELFELSKLDAGRVTVHWERFSLAELLQDVTQEFMLAAQRRDVALVANVDGPYPVFADIALIERVLRNLIDNALRHTPPKGRIEISLTQRERDIEVCVADTGQGVEPAELPHIFDHYFRGQSATGTDRESGTGLGLAIVKRILDLHGSRIEVTSSPEQGTRFRFPLPQEHAA